MTASIPTRFALLLILSSLGFTVSAFQEDVCPNGTGGWQECLINPCEAEDESPHCGKFSSLTSLSTTFLVPITGKGERSTIHFDATYLMAQAVGYTPRDAFVIAAYDQATDSGQYLHRGQSGEWALDADLCKEDPYAQDCSLASLPIGGVVRTNFRQGGFFYHFTTAEYSHAPGEGLKPKLDNPDTEPFLHALRNWVFNGSRLCVAGLVTPDGGKCFESEIREDSTFAVKIPYESETGALSSVDWVAEITEQKIVTDPATGENVPASDLSAYIPEQELPLAQLGIYLHALADRISHYKCVDASTVYGPRDANAGPVMLNPLVDLIYQAALHLGNLPGFLQEYEPTPASYDPDYLFEYDANECDQSNHFMRHSWETGHDHTQLTEENQTAEYGLYAVLDELIRFGQKNNMDGIRELALVEREELVEAILSATDTPGAQSRIDALTSLAEAKGWLPLPLHGGVSASVWDSEAGQSKFSGESLGETKSNGGCSLNNKTQSFDPVLLTLLLVSIATLLRRKV